jgi:DNA-binding IclR family transcriptional regulator
LLAAFDVRHRTLSLAELSRRSRIPTSSALRLATRLVEWGALERDGAGRYCVGPRLREVAALAPSRQGLRQVALPFMTDLAEVTHRHVQLAVRDGTQAVLVERLPAEPVDHPVGSRLPLHTTGVGLVLLAFAPPEVREELIAAPDTGGATDGLRRTLAEVRRDRLAVHPREAAAESVLSVVSVAAPVFGPGEVALGVLGVLVPHRVACPGKLGLAVQTAARGISRELGARGYCG